MIAAQQEEVLRILDFVRQQQADRLERLLSPVDVIAQEQIVRLGREAAVLEQTQQVIILTMDVTCLWEIGAAREKQRERLVKMFGTRNQPAELVVSHVYRFNGVWGRVVLI